MALPHHGCSHPLRDVTSKNRAVQSEIVRGKRKKVFGKSRGYMVGETPRTKVCEVKVICDKPSSYLYNQGKFQSIGEQYADTGCLANAMESAKIAEEQYLQLQRTKTAKLLRFQSDVTKRVRKIIKNQEFHDLNRSFQEAEHSENVPKKIILPNSQSKPDSAPLYRVSITEDKIQSSQGQNSANISNPTSTEGTSVTPESDFLVQYSEQTKILIQKAKCDLLQRRVDTESIFPLPGGSWKSSLARDKPYTLGESGENFDLKETGNILLPTKDAINSSPDTWTGKNTIIPAPTLLNSENEEKKLQDIDDDIIPESKALDFVHPGRAAVRAKLQAKSKYWNYRKHFMNLEREQVRENVRQKNHQKHIGMLQHEKEVERYQMEQQLNSVANFTNQENAEQELAHRRIQFKLPTDDEKEKEEKRREMNRYIKALKSVVQEKAKYRNINLPPLCSCGPSIWDAHPDTCANNCVFYKNPQAYARALSSVLACAEPP